MTAEVVNLRRARKTRDRAARADAAQANRMAHGRSRADRMVTEIEATRAERLLDGHRLTGDGET